MTDNRPDTSEDSDSERDQLLVAIFCFKQARKAVGLAEGLAGNDDPFDRIEQYVLKLDHVFKACRLLNKKEWPSAFPKKARNAGSVFVEHWNGTGARQLCIACADNKLHGSSKRRLIARCFECSDAKMQCNSCRNKVCKKHAKYRYGKDLRDAYSHHEHALADPTHRFRGKRVGASTVLDVEVPYWMPPSFMADAKRGPY